MVSISEPTPCADAARGHRASQASSLVCETASACSSPQVAACIERSMSRSVPLCAPRSISGSLAVRAQTPSSLASIQTMQKFYGPCSFRRPSARHLRSLQWRLIAPSSLLHSNLPVHPSRLHCCSWRFMFAAPCSWSLLSVGHHCSSSVKHERGDVCSDGMRRWVCDGCPSALLAVVAEGARGRWSASHRDER